MLYTRYIKSILPVKLKEKLRPYFLSKKYFKPLITYSPIDNAIAENCKRREKFHYQLQKNYYLPPAKNTIFERSDFVIVFGSQLFLEMFSQYSGNLMKPREIIKAFQVLNKKLSLQQIDEGGFEKTISAHEHLKDEYAKGGTIYLGGFYALQSIRSFFLNLEKYIISGILDSDKIKVCLVFDETSFLKSDELSFGIDDVLAILDNNNQLEISIHQIASTKKTKKSKYGSNVKATTHKLKELDFFNNRFSNPSFAAKKSYKSLLGKSKKKVAILDWLKLIQKPGYQSILTSLAKKNPETSFIVVDAIWEMPINSSTTNFANFNNIQFLDSLSPQLLCQFPIVFDEVFIFDIEAFLSHSLGRFVFNSLVAQGIKISIGKACKEIPSECNSQMQEFITSSRRIVDFSEEEVESLETIEKRLGSAYKYIAEAPKSIWENLFSIDSKFAKPVVWQEGLCIITLHRIRHLDNLSSTIQKATELGMVVNLVAHDLSANEQKHLEQYTLKRFPKLKIKYENKFALGRGISDAIINSDSSFWTKVDDDDTYHSYYWYEVYASLRVSLEAYIGKRARIYNFVKSEKLYAQKRMGQFGVTLSNKGHVSGATLSGATELVKRLPFPAFARYNMDVSIGSKYYEAGISRYIGSPFFLRVNRFDNKMHTWYVDQDELVENSVEIKKDACLESISYETHEKNAENVQLRKFAYIHRVLPGTIGYGFGTWMPEKITENGNQIDEFLVYNQDLTIEKVATFKAERITYSLNMITFNEEKFINFCRAHLAGKYYQISLINMPNLGKKVSIIKRFCIETKIAIDIRTPYLGNALSRKDDMFQALMFADKIFAPSLEVVETWMPSGRITDEIQNKISEIPVCINMHKGYKLCKIKQDNKKTNLNSCLKLFYNGSVNEKRQINRIVDIAQSSLLQKKCTITFCCTKEEFRNHNPSIDNLIGLNFIGVISGDDMPFVMSKYDCLLSWIPPYSVYEAAWSTKAIEAAALGIPIVGTKTLGHNSMIDSGFNLELFDETSQSFDNMINKIKTVNKIQINKNVEIATKYDWGNFVDSYVK